MSLQNDLFRIRKWLIQLAAFNIKLETHPGGWRLGCSDVMGEEVLILLEMGEEMATDTERFFKARNKAIERTVERQTLISEAQEGFATGLAYVLPSLNNLGYLPDSVLERVESESNFAFSFICGVLAALEAIKGKGYQASWMKNGETRGAMVNTERKWDRLDANVNRGATGETRTSILGDLSVYGIKWLTLRSEVDRAEFVAWLNEVREIVIKGIPA